MQQVTFAGQTYATESLYNLSTAALVDLYNSVAPGKPVRRFESRTAAVNRVWKALLDWQANAAIQEAAAAGSQPVRADSSLVVQEPVTELGKPIKPASQVERLLEVFRGHPDGINLTALSSALDIEGKRARGLIDGARARGTKIVKVDGAKSTWRLA